MKKSNVSPKRATTFKILGNSILIIAGYKDITKFTFHFLAVKLLLYKDDYLHTNNLLYSSEFIHSKVQTFHKIVLSLTHNFAANQSNTDLFTFS